MKKEGNIYGISLNTIKIIAIISMFIDHIAVYFESMITSEIYILFRIIGRVAMPLFVYSLIQGYIHTRCLKKYILRLGALGVITQVLIYLLLGINKNFYTNYICYIPEFFNILFSFVLTLILLKAIDFTKKYTSLDNKYINFLLRVITIVCIVIVFYFVNIDYNFVVPVMGINFFVFEKLKERNKSDNIKILYTIFELIFMLFISILDNILEIFVIFDVIILFLYNGKKEGKLKLNRVFTYAFFPIHHSILYLIAMLIGGKI